MASRLGRLLRNPIGALRAVIKLIIGRWEYSSPEGYRAERYWQDRHSEYGFNLKGVGDKGLSEQANRQMYLEAREVFISLCRALGVDFENSTMLDVGCGSGFYADIFHEHGGTKYLGIDIVDVLFGKLKSQFPDYRFQKLNITSQDLDGLYDLIVMFDVTQHITTEKQFSFAMQNIKSHLSGAGVFIVTSWLKDGIRNSFYEVSRSIDHYKREFQDCEFSDAIPFRDKFIFSIRTHN